MIFAKSIFWAYKPAPDGTNGIAKAPTLMRWYWSFAGKAQASAMSSVSIADLGTFFWIFESPRNIDTKPLCF